MAAEAERGIGAALGIEAFAVGAVEAPGRPRLTGGAGSSALAGAALGLRAAR